MPEQSPPYSENHQIEALAALHKQLELADEIENPVERFFKRETLLEKQEELQAEIDLSTFPPDMA